MKHCLKPLPVSEEMLGAYLEGNLSVAESSMIKSIIDSDDLFRDFVNELSIPGSINMGPRDDTFPTLDTDFILPEIPEVTFPELTNLAPDLIDGILAAPVISLDEESSMLTNDNQESDGRLIFSNDSGDPSFAMPENSDCSNNDDSDAPFPDNI